MSMLLFGKGSLGCWVVSQLCLREDRDTPWTSWQFMAGSHRDHTTFCTQTHTSGQSRVPVHPTCMFCWIVYLFCADWDLYCYPPLCLLSGSCLCPLHLETTGTASKWKWICSRDVLGIDYGNRQVCQNVELPLSHCKKTMVMKGLVCCPSYSAFSG